MHVVFISPLQQDTKKQAARPDSTHYMLLLRLLFGQSLRYARAALYDSDILTKEHTSLGDIVDDHIKSIFRCHGAVHMEPPLLLPSTKSEVDDPHTVRLLDRHGDLVCLPRNALYSYARSAARMDIHRIKRFSIMHVYQPRYVMSIDKIII
jgi:translation initiation factor 2-alpha kinase 4